MEAAHATPSVLALAKDPERLARLEEANKLLEAIQKVRQPNNDLCYACKAIFAILLYVLVRLAQLKWLA
jgi:hypothetical protein